MSIHAQKTAGTVAAELKMTRTKLPDGSFLLVEGPDDRRFWSRWVDARCTSVIAGGKATLLAALRRLDVAGFRGVLGIADADLDRLRRTPCPSPNLVWTHAHDLETSLVHLGVARAVVHELGDIDRLEAFEHREGTKLERALFERALAFGRIRCAQALHHPEANLSWLKIPRFVDDDWAIRVDALEQAAIDAGLGPSLEALDPWIQGHASQHSWDLVQGHDLVYLLTTGLRRALGSLPGSRGYDDVARALRLAIDSAELRQAPFYEDVRAWEQSNLPHQILRPLS